VPDAAGEVAFEAAHGFEAGLTFGALASDVVLGLGLTAGARERDAVDGRIELAVAAAVEAVAVGLARTDRDRGHAGRARELGSGGETLDAGDLAEQLGGGQRAEAWFVEQVRRDVRDEVGDFRFELVEADGQLAQPAQLVASDPDAGGLLGARQAPGDPGRPLLRRTTR
jgi:hypothetical protein